MIPKDDVLFAEGKVADLVTVIEQVVVLGKDQFLLEQLLLQVASQSLYLI